MRSRECRNGERRGYGIPDVTRFHINGIYLISRRLFPKDVSKTNSTRYEAYEYDLYISWNVRVRRLRIREKLKKEKNVTLRPGEETVKSLGRNKP